METLSVRKTKNLDKVLLQYLRHELKGDVFWKGYINDTQNKPSIHMAVFIEPFLQFVLEGKKTIESRFSINQCAPFNKVSKGDILLIKKSGGPIVAICRISERWYYNLSPESWTEIKTYRDALCAHDPGFWKQKKDASYATLMKISNVREINPLKIEKKDRRGWIVISSLNNQFSLL